MPTDLGRQSVFLHGPRSAYHTPMGRFFRLSCVFMLDLALTDCSDKLTMGPTDGLVDGIVVFEHANFQGRSAHITTDIRNLADFDGPCEHVGSGTPTAAGTTSHDWNDCISSVRVAPGWSATLYRASGYRDDSLFVPTDMPNLQLASHDCPHGGLNDCVTSIRVRRR